MDLGGEKGSSELTVDSRKRTHGKLNNAVKP